MPVIEVLGIGKDVTDSSLLRMEEQIQDAIGAIGVMGIVAPREQTTVDFVLCHSPAGRKGAKITAKVLIKRKPGRTEEVQLLVAEAVRSVLADWLPAARVEVCINDAIFINKKPQAQPGA